MSNALIDHYKQVRARMGMAPPRPVVKMPEPVPVPPPIRADAALPTTRRMPTKAPRVAKERAATQEMRTLVKLAMSRPVLPKNVRIPICAIQFAVADYYRITHDELVGYQRKNMFTFPRHVAMYLCRKLGERSYSEVARAFSHRDHTTVVHAVERIEGLLTGWQDIHTAHAILVIQSNLLDEAFVYWGA